MMGHGAKFGRKQEQAIAALLSSRSVEEAAKTAGVGPATLLRWQKMPAFKAAYHEARREALGQATARLQQASGAAVSTLLKVMVSPDSPVPSRVRAAECVLDRAQRGFELEDLELRLQKLEEAQAKR